MALTPTFSICEAANCESLTFTETTGAYNASTNTGGWGSPNATIASVTAMTLTVLLPDEETEAEFDLLDSGDFPTTDDTVEYDITAADLGYGSSGSLPDGKYVFTLTIVADGTTYTNQVTKLFYCQTKCCVYQLLAELPDTECACEDKKVKNALRAFTFLQGLINTAKCGDTSRFTKILKITTRMCDSVDCGCS